MEILIAIAILGILAGVGFTSYTSSISKARDAQRKSDLQEMAKALEAYQSDFGVYPVAANGMISGCGNGNQVCSWGSAFSLDGGKVYMRLLPTDSRSGYYYSYQASTDRRRYQLFARLENERDPGVVESIAVICSDGGDNCNYGIASPNATINEVLQ